MFWLYFLIPLTIIIVLAVLVDKQNNKKGLKTRVKHSDIKHLCMQEPPESSRSSK